MWLIYKVVEKAALEASSGELPFNLGTFYLCQNYSWSIKNNFILRSTLFNFIRVLIQHITEKKCETNISSSHWYIHLHRRVTGGVLVSLAGASTTVPFGIYSATVLKGQNDILPSCGGRWWWWWVGVQLGWDLVFQYSANYSIRPVNEGNVILLDI